MAVPKRSQRLKIVMDMIHREEEQERKKLGEFRTLLQTAEAKIEQLVAYQRQYQDELRASHATVQSIRHIQTYHLFISRLGTAIEQQQQQTLLIRQRMDAQTLVWQQVYQKCKNMEDYIERCRQEEQLDDDKKEQRSLDDEVNRRAFNKSL